MSDTKKSVSELDAALTPEVESQLDELERLVHRCARIGTMSLWTIVAMILVAVSPLVVALIFRAYAVRGIFTLSAALLLSLLLYLLLVYERCRKRGRVLYEELSDELQWRITSGDDKTSTIRRKRNPGIRARVVLRSFVYSTDLPMLSGNTAAFVYFASGVALLFASVWFDSFYSR